MVRDFVLNGTTYELQITLREMVGATSFGPINEAAASRVMSGIRDMLDEAVSAVEYAAEQRRYEASCSNDEDDSDSISECAESWEGLAIWLSRFLA